MGSFNWVRAAEGSLVSALITGASTAQLMFTGSSSTTITRSALVSIAVTVITAFIKGFGQQVQSELTGGK